MKKNLLVAVAIAFLLQGCKSLGDTFLRPATIPDTEIKVRAFDEATEKAVYSGTLPLTLALPKDFETVRTKDGRGVIWMDAGNMALLREQKPVSPSVPFFFARVSLNVGYDKATNSFGTAESISAIKAAGARNVKTDKYNVKGIPILLVETEVSNSESIYMAYLATGLSTNVILISLRDVNGNGTAVWNAFRSHLIKQ